MLTEEQINAILAVMNKKRDANTGEFQFIGSVLYNEIIHVLLRAEETIAGCTEKVLWLLQFDEDEDIDVSLSFPPEEQAWDILEAYYKQQKERR